MIARLSLPILLLAAAGAVDADPLKDAQNLLGKEVSCEPIEKIAIVATDADDPTAAGFKASAVETVKAITSRAFTPSLEKPLLIYRAANAARYAEGAVRLLGHAANPPAVLDPVQMRMILLAGDGDAYVDAVVPGLLLARHLHTTFYPPWLMTGLTLLTEKRVADESLFDARAGLLKNPLREAERPGLKAFLNLSLDQFNDSRKLPLHAAFAKAWFGYLESKGALKKFFEAYPKTLKSDRAGVTAAATALGKTWDEVDKDFQVYLRALPWIDRKRFEDGGRSLFGDAVRVRIDDDWQLALCGNVPEGRMDECIKRVKELAPALVKTFDMTPSGLPVLGRLFAGTGAMEDHLHMVAKDRQWFAGFYLENRRIAVANLSAGTDTFVHEYCHSLFIDDFQPLFPNWLGEGLPSLYEEYTVENGTARGIPGSTLDTIRAARDEKACPGIKELISMRGEEFYSRDRKATHIHYQLSRAFLLYLQDKNILVRFYKNLRATRVDTARADPFCLKALEKETGMDVDRIDADFFRWLQAQPRNR